MANEASTPAVYHNRPGMFRREQLVAGNLLDRSEHYHSIGATGYDIGGAMDKRRRSYITDYRLQECKDPNERLWLCVVEEALNNLWEKPYTGDDGARRKQKRIDKRTAQEYLFGKNSPFSYHMDLIDINPDWAREKIKKRGLDGN
jgi:hypothetical protein